MSARYTRGTTSPKKKAPKPFSRPADTPKVAVVKPAYRGTPAASRGAPRTVVSPTSTAGQAYYPTKPKRRGPSPAKKVVRQARRRLRQTAESQAQARVAKARQALSKSPGPDRYESLAVKFGRKEGVSPALLSALMEQESGFNKRAVSSAGAVGATQFIPSTAAIYGVKQGKLKSQVRGAAKYLKDLGVQSDPRKALGGYYGSGTELLPSGKTYPEEVLEKTSKYRKLDKLAPKAAMKATPHKLPGAWSGSKREAKSIIPKGITPTSTKRTPEANASVGGSSTSDHLTTSKSSWAYDFADDPKISAKIASKLGLKNFEHGQNVTVYKDGYRIQLLTAPHGTGPHVHLGVKWEGSGAVGTSTGGTSIAGVAGATKIGAAGVAGTSGGRRPTKRKRGSWFENFLAGLDVKGKPAETKAVQVPEKLKKIQEERKRAAKVTRVNL